MSTNSSGITVVKGDGVYPPPRIRRIYPDNALLWKFILEAFIIWLFALSALLTALCQAQKALQMSGICIIS